MDITAESRSWRPVETRDTDILDQVYRLRVEAWRARNPAFPQMERWTDGFDAVARHWVVMDANRPVAAARLTIHETLAEAPDAEVYEGILPSELPGPVGALSRLVVAPGLSGRGCSRLLDLARIEAAMEKRCLHIVGATAAGEVRVEAMRTLGFEVVGLAGAYRSGPLASVDADTNPTVVVSLDLSRLRPIAD